MHHIGRDETRALLNSTGPYQRLRAVGADIPSDRPLFRIDTLGTPLRTCAGHRGRFQHRPGRPSCLATMDDMISLQKGGFVGLQIVNNNELQPARPIVMCKNVRALRAAVHVRSSGLYHQVPAVPVTVVIIVASLRSECEGSEVQIVSAQCLPHAGLLASELA